LRGEIQLNKIKAIIILTMIFFTIISSISSGNVFITPRVGTLGIGSSGDEVEKVQQRLKNWGYYDGKVNGEYGFETCIAVREFQRSLGLFANGTAGKETLMVMGLVTTGRSGEAYAQGGKTGDEQLLARAINGEARGEPYEGQVAVGAVILNRVKDSKFPKTIAGVIYQPGAFTAVADGQINVAIDPASTVVKAARDALNGWDPTNGCIYYFNPATATSQWIWSRKIIKKIGKHNFAI
jgi:N-acetylmuramoyl-L-alanine amidase